MKWSHAMRGHLGARESLLDFNKWFYTTMDAGELLKTMQSITNACPCKASIQSYIADRGLYSSLPIPYCRNSLLHVDFVTMNKFGSCNSVLVVTYALTRYTLMSIPSAPSAPARTLSRPSRRLGSRMRCPQMRTYTSGLGAACDLYVRSTHPRAFFKHLIVSPPSSGFWAAGAFGSSSCFWCSHDFGQWNLGLWSLQRVLQSLLLPPHGLLQGPIRLNTTGQLWLQIRATGSAAHPPNAQLDGNVKCPPIIQIIMCHNKDAVDESKQFISVETKGRKSTGFVHNNKGP